MPSTHRIPPLAIAVALAVTLLAGVAAASTPVYAAQATVPVSQYNARWAREPASGPLPPVAVPADTGAEPRNHTVSASSPAWSCSRSAPARRPGSESGDASSREPALDRAARV